MMPRFSHNTNYRRTDFPKEQRLGIYRRKTLLRGDRVRLIIRPEVSQHHFCALREEFRSTPRSPKTDEVYRQYARARPPDKHGCRCSQNGTIALSCGSTIIAF